MYGDGRKYEYLSRDQHTLDMRLSMTVAEKVKALRLKKAWSQEQLAEPLNYYMIYFSSIHFTH